MANVVTVYCAGTEFDSKSDDIIAWLNQNTAGVRGSSLLFFPGPGSNEYADSLTTHTAEVAAKSISQRRIAYAPGMRIAADSAANMAAGVNQVEKTYDAMTGDSLHARIKLALAKLRDAKAAGSTVNLVGWSRGAVTCLGIAYALAEDAALYSCKVNLFLFDPVPGPEKMGLNGANWAKELTSLRDNINSLAVVLMENDARDWMMPPLTAPFTVCSKEACGGVARSKIALYPMPGAHSSAVMAGGRYQESADIGAHLVSEFLLAAGSKLPSDKMRSDGALINLYALLKQKTLYGFIANERNYALRVTVGRHSAAEVIAVPVARLAKIPNAARGTRFFVNQHHANLVAKAFPNIAWILDPTLPPLGWSAASPVEARLLRASCPNMSQLIADGVAAILAQKNVCLRDEADLQKLLDVFVNVCPIPSLLCTPVDAGARRGFSRGTTAGW